MDKRAQNEKKFHDLRFEDGVGYRKQDKFYKTVEPAYDLTNSIIDEFALTGGCGLEYGCSTGENLKNLKKKYDFDAIGIDISPKAIEVAQLNLRGLQGPLEVYVMDANAPDFEDGKFDFCFGRGVLHHLTWPESIVQLNRILRPSARFVFIEPLGTNPLINLYRKLTPGDRSPDELPLGQEHIQLLKTMFPFVRFRYYGFLSIALYALDEQSKWFASLLNFATKLDSLIFKVPGLWRLAWVVVVEGKK